MKTERILWVTPQHEEWHVQEGNLDRHEASFDAREDAVEWACRVAQFRGPAAVRVLDYNGNITGQFFFAPGDNRHARPPVADKRDRLAKIA
ncbi:DUF2188 domain-containing protein [Lacibacterium aquatile]|uniref:DUF2188 domain-containing protein n=1 Tax=Lacibacterium aquatile TaxID=1168082 RepID=A0ABW5DSU3_9PROT